MTVVSARGLVKAFGEGRAARRVLDGADLDVAAGEVVAVLGRSGSGKSTLLHLLGGLDRPDAGTVDVAGEAVTGASERALSELRRRRIGFVFQFFHLLPELSGEANVLLAGSLPGAHPDASARGRALVDSLGAPRRRERAAAPALGGRQQRFRHRPGARQRPCRAAGRRADGQTSTRTRAAEVLRLLRAGAGEGRAVVLVTHEHAAAGICGPCAHAARGDASWAERAALALARAARPPRRTLLAALGIVAASLVVGTAVTVGYGLATGFGRAADRRDLPDVIARFEAPSRAPGSTSGWPRLPNLAARSYRFERTNTVLESRGRLIHSGSLQVVLGGRRGYDIVAGRDLRGSGDEVVIERGLAREWGLAPGDRLDVGPLGSLRVVGVAVSPDNVAYPLPPRPGCTCAAPCRWPTSRCCGSTTGQGGRHAHPGTRRVVRHRPARGSSPARVCACCSTRPRGSSSRCSWRSRSSRWRRRGRCSRPEPTPRSSGGCRRWGAAGARLHAGRIAGLSAVEAVVVAVPAAVLGLGVGALAVAGPAGGLLASLNELSRGWRCSGRSRWPSRSWWRSSSARRPGPRGAPPGDRP
jgi:ABC-type lipoprotein export system ATPase subunit